MSSGMAFVRDSIDSFGLDRQFLKIRSQTPIVRLEGGRFRGNQGRLVGQQQQVTDALASLGQSAATMCPSIVAAAGVLDLR